MSVSVNRLSWVEIDTVALRNNLEEFKRIKAPDALLYLVVKANAYRHSSSEDRGHTVSVIREEPQGLGPNGLIVVEKIRQGAGDLDSLCEETGLSVFQLLSIVGYVGDQGHRM